MMDAYNAWLFDMGRDVMYAVSLLAIGRYSAKVLGKRHNDVDKPDDFEQAERQIINVNREARQAIIHAAMRRAREQQDCPTMPIRRDWRQ